MSEWDWFCLDDIARKLCLVVHGFDPCMGVRRDKQKLIPYHHMSIRKIMLFHVALRQFILFLTHDSIESDASKKEIQVIESRLDNPNLMRAFSSESETFRNVVYNDVTNLIASEKTLTPKTMCSVLSEIIGNPFEQPKYFWCDKQLYPNTIQVQYGQRVIAVDEKQVPVTWMNSTVSSLAQAAYEYRKSSGELDHARLSVLADAMEENGCTEHEWLAHLRRGFSQIPYVMWSGHVRGCHVLDTLLNRE